MARHPVDRLSERQWALLLETYTDLQRLMTSNEEIGERRLQIYLTVVGAAGVTLGLVVESFRGQLWWAVSVATALLTLFGYATLVRIAKRDAATAWLKEDLFVIRTFVSEGRPGLCAALPHMGQLVDKVRLRTRPWGPQGGLVDMVGILTAVFGAMALGAVVFASLSASAAEDERPVLAGVAFGVGALAGVGLWLLQIWRVRIVYDDETVLDTARTPRPSRPPWHDASRRREQVPARDRLAPGLRDDASVRGTEKDHSPAPAGPAETFRANVGIVVHDGAGRVLIFQRRGHPGSWQFPQGGIEPGEDPRAAAWRELREETGLGESDVRIERELGRWLTYELPPEARSEKSGRGQTQWWVLARTTRPLEPSTPPPGEFSDAAWVTWEEALGRVWEVKRPVYEELAHAFGGRG